MVITSTIKDERSSIPWRDGKILGHFSSANMVDKSSAKKEGVASEESDGELSRSILNKRAEVLDPVGKL